MFALLNSFTTEWPVASKFPTVFVKPCLESRQRQPWCYVPICICFAWTFILCCFKFVLETTTYIMVIWYFTHMLVNLAVLSPLWSWCCWMRLMPWQRMPNLHCAEVWALWADYRFQHEWIYYFHSFFFWSKLFAYLTWLVLFPCVVIEKYTKHTRFALICNHVNKIIPALQSRCTRFRFAPLDRIYVADRLKHVIAAEG